MTLLNLLVYPILMVFINDGARGMPVNKCPTGEILHNVQESIPRCCKPWPFPCPINYQYRVCERTGDWDKCVSCEEGFIQPTPSNWTHQIACYENTLICNSDNVPLDKSPPRKGSIPNCVCDLSANYYPLLGGVACDYKPNGCPIGKELNIYGGCSHCQQGTYKSWSGVGLCIPWTNCEADSFPTTQEGSHDRDRICDKGGQPSPMLTSTHHRALPTSRIQPTNAYNKLTSTPKYGRFTHAPIPTSTRRNTSSVSGCNITKLLQLPNGDSASDLSCWFSDLLSLNDCKCGRLLLMITKIYIPSVTILLTCVICLCHWCVQKSYKYAPVTQSAEAFGVVQAPLISEQRNKCFRERAKLSS